jgi:hypothetical protein
MPSELATQHGMLVLHWPDQPLSQLPLFDFHASCFHQSDSPACQGGRTLGRSPAVIKDTWQNIPCHRAGKHCAPVQWAGANADCILGITPLTPLVGGSWRQRVCHLLHKAVVPLQLLVCLLRRLPPLKVQAPHVAGGQEPEVLRRARDSNWLRHDSNKGSGRTMIGSGSLHALRSAGADVMQECVRP